MSSYIPPPSERLIKVENRADWGKERGGGVEVIFKIYKGTTRASNNYKESLNEDLSIRFGI